jgi:hypothetical protein
MASTIAPTAAKPATWPSRIPVADPKSVTLQIDADRRFATAAGGVARYLGDSSGLESGSASRLQAAVVAACQEAFEYLTAEHPHLTVAFTRHADRIEIAISYEGESAPAVGLDTIASGSAALDGVDRIQYETQGGRTTTLLTKYLA